MSFVCTDADVTLFATMKPIVALLLLFAFPLVTVGQECTYPDSSAVADTLSADAYLPLAVGNTWEYEISSDSVVVAIERNEIVGYAFFKEIFYYRLDTRYYSVSDSIVATGVQTDYVRITDSSYVRNGSVAPLAIDLKFNASFSSCYRGAYPDGDSNLVSVGLADSSYYTFDEAGSAVDVPLPAIKQYSVASDTSSHYGHGLGLVITSGRRSRKLIHAVIDGEPYGTPLAERYAIPVSVAAEDSRFVESIHVYPNPATAVTTIFRNGPVSDRGVNMHLVDIAGRTQRLFRIDSGSNHILLDVSALASGVYFVVGTGVRPIPLVIAR